jgi:arsenate reductase (thioredoxin)
VCSNAEAHCPIFSGVVWRLFWPFDDPAVVEGTEQVKLQKFREVRDRIHGQIRQWIYHLQKKHALAPTMLKSYDD